MSGNAGAKGSEAGRKVGSLLYIGDFSLALINRTGAYYNFRDVVENLSPFFAQVRYWRFFLKRPPEGLRRKILARLMLKEIGLLGESSWPRWPDGRYRGRLPTVFFDPLYVLRARLKTEDIVLCHDIGPVSHPELFDPSTQHSYEMAYAKIQAAKPGMVFVSDASQRAFCARYGDRFRFLQTIPVYPRAATREGALAPVDGVAPPFLLTVGSVDRRKNQRRVIEAFARAGLHDRGISYVFCGPHGNDADKILAAAAATPGVIPLPYMSAAQLRWLYRNAMGFVLPSLLEGFGVPALEAAALGLVPLVSRGGAQEEAIGGQGILVDPTSVDSIAAGLSTLADMPTAERATLAARAKAHAETLTFDRFLQSWKAVLTVNGPIQSAKR